MIRFTFKGIEFSTDSAEETAQLISLEQVMERWNRMFNAAPAMHLALLAIRSQCSGHADEFSQRVADLANEALRKIGD